MLKLSKFLIGFVFLLTFLYFAFFVQLGSKTLYWHMVGISETEEAKDLGDGIKQKASDVTDEVTDHIPEMRDLGERVERVKAAAKAEPGKEGAGDDSKVEAKDPIAELIETVSKDEKPSSLAEVSDNDKDALNQLLKSKLSN